MTQDDKIIEKDDDDEKSDNVFGAKILLLIISVAFGATAGFLVSSNNDSGIQAIVFALISGVLYPIFGALAVKLSSLLKYIASSGKGKAWSRQKCIGLATIWPAVLLYSLIVYPSLFVINLLF